VFFLLDLIPQMDLTLFHQYYAQEQGLDRFLETQHGGHEGIQRSRNPSPTHEVRTQKNYWNEFVLSIITIKRTQSRCRGYLI